MTDGRLRIRSRLLAACAIAAVLTRAVLFAASAYSGRVLFGDVPVPGATVVASQGDRQISTVTDEQGTFSFAALDEGAWTIRVEMLAFTPIVREVTIASGMAPSEWKLTLRPLDELLRQTQTGPAPAVTARAAAPAVAAPRSPSAASPRSTTTAPAIPAASPASASAEDSADASATADGLVINGSVNNAAASSVAQSAAFGNNRRRPGALYNGGVALIFGSSAFDSRPFTFGSTPEIRPDYNNVKVVTTFGGPLKISQTLRKDPIVFLSYQHAGDHSATTQPAVMPTASERVGDFSNLMTAAGQPVQIRDPLTGQPFPGNIIPAGRISPQAMSLLNYYPLPTIATADGFNFQAPLLTGTTQNQLTSRVTQSLKTNDQLIGLFAYQRSSTNQTTLFNFNDASALSGIDTSVTWTHRASQTLSTRFRYQFTRQTSSATPYFANRTNVSGDAGITGNDQDPTNWGPPALQFSSIAGLSDALPASTQNATNSAGGDVYWTRGHHNVTAGGDIRHVSTDVRSQLNPRGSFAFTGAITGSDVADFLLGLPSASTIAYGNADKDFRAKAADLYITDDWRFSPTLTMQVGARWEYEAPPTERLGRLVNLDLATGFSAAQPVLAGSSGPLTGQLAPAGLIHPDWSGFQPRLGMAWRPIVGSSLLVRAGYGIYRNTGIYQPITTLLAQQPPLSTAFTVSNSAATPLSLSTGFASPGTATNTFAVDPHLRVGRSQNWQVLVQRDVFGFLTVSASYLETRGDHLLQESLPNTYPVGGVNPCPACPSGFVYLTSNGQSARHAGQWQLRWRLHRGLAASVQYTLAKATDNATAFAAVSLGGSAISQDWTNLDAEHARSNFDRRHEVVAQVQYTSGVGMGGGALMDGITGRLLAGWTATTQLTTGSGLPFTPVYLAPIGGSGVVGVLRPSLTGASLNAPAGYYLNPAAYTTPAAGQFGNAGRNSVTGPSEFSCDLGVARTFQWTPRLTFDWRIDATNVLNRETYTGVNAVVGGSQFGLPSLTNTPRRVLSTMRLRF